MDLERLHAYLGELSLEARNGLVAECELAMLRNEDFPDADVILRELTQSLRAARQSFARIGNPMRVFFHPLQPFLIDGAPEILRRGEIARGSLRPIWAWICRELLPEGAKTHVELSKRALLSRDTRAAQGLAQAFQDQVMNRVESMMAVSDRSVVVGRLSSYMAPARAADDLAAIIRIFKGRDALAALGASLPARIVELDDAEAVRALAALEQLTRTDEQLVLYGLIIVMRRLVTPWQLIHVAFRAAGSHRAEQIARGRYAIAVGLVFRFYEDQLAAWRELAKSDESERAVTLLTGLRSAIEAMGKLDLPQECVWAKRLANLRAGIAA